MGADLQAAAGDGAPTFMVYALRDAIGANLDRIQIVKGWLDGKGKTQEKVYDVAWSDDRELDSQRQTPAGRQHSEHRCSKLDQHHRCIRARHGLDRSGLRSAAKRFLLRARAGNPDATLGCLRRVPIRYGDTRGRRNDSPGARLHFADLVYALSR